MNTQFDQILDHYTSRWQSSPKIHLWDKGRIEKLPFEFRVLEFAPSTSRNMWIYATIGMSKGDDSSKIELHIFSLHQDDRLIELLTAVVFYHANTSKLDLWHTVNFGRPWQNNSSCEYGLISLPYLDGPDLENLELGNILIKLYWLIPVTSKEVQFKAKYGIEALEQKFESKSFNYVDSKRKSVV